MRRVSSYPEDLDQIIELTEVGRMGRKFGENRDLDKVAIRPDERIEAGMEDSNPKIKESRSLI